MAFASVAASLQGHSHRPRLNGTDRGKSIPRRHRGSYVAPVVDDRCGCEGTQIQRQVSNRTNLTGSDILKSCGFGVWVRLAVGSRFGIACLAKGVARKDRGGLCFAIKPQTLR